MSSLYNLVRDEKQPKYSIISLFTATAAMLYISRSQSLIQHCVHKVRHKIMKVNPQRFDFLPWHCIVLENVAAAQRGYAADMWYILGQSSTRTCWDAFGAIGDLTVWCIHAKMLTWVVDHFQISLCGQWTFMSMVNIVQVSHQSEWFFLNVCFKIYVHPINQLFFVPWNRCKKASNKIWFFFSLCIAWNVHCER